MYEKVKRISEGVVKDPANPDQDQEERCGSGICTRSKGGVICRNCFSKFPNVRSRKSCPEHPNVLFSMDLHKCPNCKSSEIDDIDAASAVSQRVPPLPAFIPPPPIPTPPKVVASCSQFKGPSAKKTFDSPVPSFALLTPPRSVDRPTSISISVPVFPISKMNVSPTSQLPGSSNEFMPSGHFPIASAAKGISGLTPSSSAGIFNQTGLSSRNGGNSSHGGAGAARFQSPPTPVEASGIGMQIPARGFQSFQMPSGSGGIQIQRPAEALLMPPGRGQRHAAAVDCICNRRISYLLCDHCGFYEPGSKGRKKRTLCPAHPHVVPEGLEKCPDCQLNDLEETVI